MGEVRDLVERVLRAPGGVARVLATSQLTIGVSGESLLEVRPLSIDGARELFRLRAHDARRAWDGAGDERIDRVVAALDRLPLTIEMAAARMRTTTFDDIESIVLGTVGPQSMTHRASAPRQRSIESMTAWSAGLLEPHHRRLFAEVSVFAGSMTADDVAAVLAPGDANAIAARLADLAERSLLVADVAGSRTRYSMLSTVRSVASRWLDEADPHQHVRRQHAEHFSTVLVEVDDALRTPAEAHAQRRLSGVVGDLRAAHLWASQHQPGLASDMSGSLFHAAYSTLWSEPATWSSTVLRSDGEVDEATSGAALVVAGAAAHRGDLAAARRLASPVEALGPGRLQAAALELLVDVAFYEGDLAGVGAAAERLHNLGASLGDAHLVAFGLLDAALALAYGGDPSAALAMLEERHHLELGPTDSAWLSYGRGEALALLGVEAAVDSFREAIAIASGVANAYVTCVARISLASELTRLDRRSDALAEYATALLEFQRHGNHTHAVTAIRNLVGLFEALGDDRSVALLVGALAEEPRPTYGAEAQKLQGWLSAATARSGSGPVDVWLDEGRALFDRVEDVAADLVDQHLERIRR